MTCIDAAIIKALVEHIGMDPDSVGNGQNNFAINATWTVKNEDTYDLLSFEFPAGQSPKLGMCLKLNGDSEKGMPEEFITYCVAISNSELTFSTEDSKIDIVCKRVGEGKYLFEEVILGMNLKSLPDNNTFGLFETVFNNYAPIFNYLLNTAHYLRNQNTTRHSEIINLQNRMDELSNE